MLRKRHTALIVAGLVLTAGLAAASPRGSPDLSVFAPDNDVIPGEETGFGVVILNGGTIEIGGSPDDERRITTARNLRLTLRNGSAPIEIETGTQPVGSVPEGRVGPVNFAISVDENATPGTYRLPVTLEYKYTNTIVNTDPRVPDHQETRTIERTHVGIEIEDAPRFEVVDTRAGAFPEGTGTLRLEVRNVGTGTAHGATLSVRSSDPRLTFGGSPEARTYVGGWRPNETRTLAFETRLAEGADRRQYPLSVSVEYENENGQARRSDPLSTGATVGARVNRFRVVDAVADVAVGNAGTVRITVRNVGEKRVTDARVALASGDPKLTFAGAPRAETFVGPWAPGETRTLAFKTRVAAGADVRSYPLAATVTYEEPDGDTGESGPLSTGVVPAPEQTFDVEAVRSTLAVGEEGRLRGRVVNTGNRSVRNAVVVLSDDSPTVRPVETEYSLGDLDPGASVPFEFAIEISDSADGGPRQLSLQVRYRDADGDTRRGDAIDVRVDVAPKRDTFRVEPVAAAVSAGKSAEITLRVTNAGNETVSDVSAKLFADDPISTSDDEAFIEELAPGESEAIAFEVSAGGGALEKPYPVSLDFQYDDADGDTLLSDTYKVALQVERDQGGGRLPVLLGGIALLVALGAGAYLYRRRG